MQENATRMNRVLAALKRAGVADKDVSTSSINLSPQYRYVENQAPVVIGHSFGGLLTQITAGRGLARAAVAIDPAPFKGVLPLPVSTLKGAFPVLKNPANKGKAVRLTFDEFRYGFANAVPETEARRLYDTQHVPAPGRPLFQAAFANVNPKAATKVDTARADRGPLLVISGGNDNIVPWAVANAAYKIQSKKNPNPTEI